MSVPNLISWIMVDRPIDCHPRLEQCKKTYPMQWKANKVQMQVSKSLFLVLTSSPRHDCFAKVVMDFYCIAVTSGLKGFVLCWLFTLRQKQKIKNIINVISNAFGCVNGKGYCIRNMKQLILQDIWRLQTLLSSVWFPEFHIMFMS